MKRSTKRESQRRKRAASSIAERTPPKWSKGQLERVEKWMLSGAPEATRSEWLTLPEKERLRRTKLALESIWRDKVAEPLARLDRERDAIERERWRLDRDVFLASWKLAESRVSFLSEEIDDKLAEAKELTEENARAAPVNGERVVETTRLVAEIDELLALRDDMEAAMASAAHEAEKKLSPALERWDSHTHWAAALELANAWPKDSRPSEESLKSLAARLLIDVERVKAAVEAHAGDRAADGPKKAARNVVGDLVEKDPRTIERRKPSANAEELFRRLARAKSPDDETPNLFGLLGSYFEREK